MFLVSANVRSFCVLFWSADIFGLELSHFFFVIVQSWTLTSGEASEVAQGLLCYSGFVHDPLDGFWQAECSWDGSLLFSPFVDASECGSLESQSLRNGFVTLSRLIDFISHLFLNVLLVAWWVAFQALLASFASFFLLLQILSHHTVRFSPAG